MDIGSSFSYMFQDEGWIKKILIGGVVGIIPIVNFAAIGYMIQIIRNVREGQALPLPEWDEFGKYFMDGLWIFLIFLVWSIPIIVVVCFLVAGVVATGQDDNLGGTATAIVVCFGCLTALWALLVAAVTPAIMVRFAESGDFSSGFRFGEIMSFISADVGNYIIVILLWWLAGLIAGLVGLILCFVGAIFTQFWSYLVGGHLMGQLAAQQQSTELTV